MAMGGMTSERRRWLRYEPRERRVYLGWWQGETFRTTTARLRDVGRGGATVEADGLLPEDVSAWICSILDDAGGWIETAVRPVFRRPRGPHRLRLVFRDTSATEAFLEAVTLRSKRPTDTPGTEAIELLGLKWPCSTDEVRRAFHTLALRDHPDRGGTTERFVRLRDAYTMAMSRCRDLAR